VRELSPQLQPRLEAHEPPEARGLRRDQVRLMVASRHDGSVIHTRFHELPLFLSEGDLIVVNTSATLPAALPALREDGSELELRLSTRAPHSDDASWWRIELRLGDSPFRGGRVGERLSLPDGGSATILAPYAGGARLWLARLELPEPVHAYLGRHGHPIRYRYVPREWPLDQYQNVYALEPGSAEMASAGRPFTPELVTSLVARGVQVAPLTLHTGVSSPEVGEPPYAEPYRVPAPTAQLVNAVHEWGGRVIAVGTTVVRALESATDTDGVTHSESGWTDVVITPERGVHAIDGLLTGWHAPEATHLQMLEAVAGRRALEIAYPAAVAAGYHWHEFGDSHLLLPDRET
jgi:S-adenosylmethionine:tRNA ribosyltransferase-isomerase